MDGENSSAVRPCLLGHSDGEKAMLGGGTWRRGERAASTRPLRLQDDGGWYLVPWADDAGNEAAIKAETKATIRCYPLDAQDQLENKSCFYSGKPATHMALFARAY